MKKIIKNIIELLINIIKIIIDIKQKMKKNKIINFTNKKQDMIKNLTKIINFTNKKQDMIKNLTNKIIIRKIIMEIMMKKTKAKIIKGIFYINIRAKSGYTKNDQNF